LWKVKTKVLQNITHNIKNVIWILLFKTCYGIFYLILYTIKKHFLFARQPQYSKNQFFCNTLFDFSTTFEGVLQKTKKKQNVFLLYEIRWYLSWCVMIFDEVLWIYVRHGRTQNRRGHILRNRVFFNERCARHNI